MLKLCGTFVAALKFALPACDAVIVQEPAARIRTVPGAGVVTRQLLFALLALKLTGNPEEAVGFTMKSGSPNVLGANGPNVMVWFAFRMLKLNGTSASRVQCVATTLDALMTLEP